MMRVYGLLAVLGAASVSALRTPHDADLTRPAAKSHSEFAAEVLKMRDTMHTMTREEQDRRLAEIKHFGRELEREHQVRRELPAPDGPFRIRGFHLAPCTHSDPCAKPT